MSRLRVTLLSCCLASAASCATSDEGPDDQTLCALQIGRSTIDDMVHLLGPPSELLQSTQGAARLHYWYSIDVRGCRNIDAFFDGHAILVSVEERSSYDCNPPEMIWVPRCLGGDAAR